MNIKISHYSFICAAYFSFGFAPPSNCQLPQTDWSNRHYAISPTSGMAPLTVHISTPAQETMSNLTMNVDWGDESKASGLSHTYHNPGTYRISIHRTSKGRTCGLDTRWYNGTEVINVLDPFPNDPKKYFLNCAEKSSRNIKQEKKTWSNPLEVRLSANINFPQCLEYFLDWGDGTLEKKGYKPGPRAVLPASAMQFKHTYKERGNYTIRFRSNNSEPRKHARDVLYYEKLDISI